MNQCPMRSRQVIRQSVSLMLLGKMMFADISMYNFPAMSANKQEQLFVRKCERLDYEYEYKKF